MQQFEIEIQKKISEFGENYNNNSRKYFPRSIYSLAIPFWKINRRLQFMVNLESPISNDLYSQLYRTPFSGLTGFPGNQGSKSTGLSLEADVNTQLSKEQKLSMLLFENLEDSVSI